MSRARHVMSSVCLSGVSDSTHKRDPTPRNLVKENLRLTIPVNLQGRHSQNIPQ